MCEQGRTVDWTRGGRRVFFCTFISEISVERVRGEGAKGGNEGYVSVRQTKKNVSFSHIYPPGEAKRRVLATFYP